MTVITLRCIDASNSNQRLIQGNTYFTRSEDARPGQGYFVFTRRRGDDVDTLSQVTTARWLRSRFQVVEPETQAAPERVNPFAVGSLVRRKDNAPAAYSMMRGATSRVTEISAQGHIKLLTIDGTYRFFSPNEFEAVTPNFANIINTNMFYDVNGSPDQLGRHIEGLYLSPASIFVLQPDNRVSVGGGRAWFRLSGTSQSIRYIQTVPVTPTPPRIEPYQTTGRAYNQDSVCCGLAHLGRFSREGEPYLDRDNGNQPTDPARLSVTLDTILPALKRGGYGMCQVNLNDGQFALFGHVLIEKGFVDTIQWRNPKTDRLIHTLFLNFN